MSVNYSIKWVGWCHETEVVNGKEKTHDKIWGWMELEDKLYNFWGKRNGKLSFKRHGDDYWSQYDLKGIVRTKSTRAKERYEEITVEKLEEVFDNFHKAMQRDLFNARMLGKVKGENNGYE